jgi:hypothetical protein
VAAAQSRCSRRRNELPWLKVDERGGATLHPPIEAQRLRAKQPPQPPEVILHSEA